MADAAATITEKDGCITIRDVATSETIRTDEVVRVIRVEFGGDFAGPATSCFWIFDLGHSAVVTPDCPPYLRRDVLPQLSPTRRPSIRWMEASCFTPPKSWSRPRLLLPRDTVQLKRIDPKELHDALMTLKDLHPVQEFGEEGL